MSSTGAKVAGPVSYLRGSTDRRADGTAYDAGAPYATWKTATYTRAQLSALVRGRRADERRDADARSTCATAASRAGSSA